MALEQLLFWSFVFDYLEPEDLVSVASVCLTWWQLVFHGRKLTSEAFHNCKDLDLADTGSMYPGGVRTTIALHCGRLVKTWPFAS